MSALEEKACGNCKCYKGAKIPCGKSSYIPQRNTDNCGGRDFEPKEQAVTILLDRTCGNCLFRQDGVCKTVVGMKYFEKVSESQDASSCKKFLRNIPGVVSCGNCNKHIDGNCSSVKVPVESWHGTACKTFNRKPAELCPEVADDFNPYVVNNQVNKETGTMSNATSIIRLADSQFNKEVTDFGGLQLDLKDALVKLQNEERQAAATAAAKEVLSVINDANEHIEFQVGQIQTFRRNIDTAKKDISEINKAKAFGLATNNFVPLAVRLGRVQEYSVTNKDLLKIDESKLPEGWDKKPEAK